MTQHELVGKIHYILELVEQGSPVALEQAYNDMQDLMDDIQSEISTYNEDDA